MHRRLTGAAAAPPGPGACGQVWDSDTGTLVHTLRKHEHDVLGVAVHPRDPRILLSAGNDGRVLVWDAQRGVLLKGACVRASGAGGGHRGRWP